jgi:hypothetical protein
MTRRRAAPGVGETVELLRPWFYRLGFVTFQAWPVYSRLGVCDRRYLSIDLMEQIWAVGGGVKIG